VTATVDYLDPLPPVLLAGSVNLLAGAPGTGKTAFLAWWITQFAQGLPVFERQPTQIPFQGWITADRSWDRSTVKWFELAGYPELPHYSLQDDRSFKKARLRNRRDRIAIFRECLDAVAQQAPGGQLPVGSLIYADPIALFLGGNLVDYDTCAVACSEIREICLDRGISVIGTAHSAKQKAEKKDRYLRLQDRILGSAALFGYTDTQLYLAAPEELDVDHYTFLWAPHHARTQTFALHRDEQGLFVPGTEMTPLPSTGGRPKVSDAWITTAFAVDNTPDQTFRQLQVHADRAGVSRATATRQIRDAVSEGRLRAVRRGVYQISRPS